MVGNHRVVFALADDNLIYHQICVTEAKKAALVWFIPDSVLANPNQLIYLLSGDEVKGNSVLSRDITVPLEDLCLFRNWKNICETKSKISFGEKEKSMIIKIIIYKYIYVFECTV